ncbi:MAG: DegT/DnrJ/EryC1/StrS family aminotransferase [Planctomycetes bacterium]|nr:DegT/DnrJ/EryC1/StrS family aminotransferase [Planctomycetota bacterium]
MSKLAINGAKPLKDIESNPWPKWPVWGDEEKKQLIEVLDSGLWSYNGPKEQQFNKAFAEFIDSEYAISAANGTVTLQLALEACGIGWGDEVIVPGLTWQATAASILDINALPILVDVTEDTWCIDPSRVEEAITPRTKAVIPVHLYGSFSDMDAIMTIAKKHGLRVIEDCAHKQGGQWKDKKAGNIGDAGSFSFQLSKLMTAGEGGALTTSDPEIYEKLDALRNCGRRPEREQDDQRTDGFYGDEGNFIQSGNYRITEFQAAMLIEALKRLPEQNKLRDENAIYLNSMLAELPGIKPMRRDERETAEAYYNFTFRYHKDEFKDLSVELFREALSKELGFTVEACYKPLNQCSLYSPLTKPWRHHITEEYWEQINPARFDLPVCKRVYEEESACFHFNVLMGSKQDMDLIVEAIKKIYENRDELNQ